MNTIRYGLQPVLSDDQKERILTDAVAVLAEIGIQCDHARMRDLVKKHPGASVSGNRLRFSKKLCRDHVQKIRRLRGGESDHLDDTHIWKSTGEVAEGEEGGG